MMMTAAEDNNSNNNKLVRISSAENWSHLLDMYKNDWPTHFVTFYTIKNYIDWNNRFPQEHHKITTTATSATTLDEFQFYSLNDDWIDDGTHMIIDKKNGHVFFNTLSENFSRLSALLQLLYSRIETEENNFYLLVFVDRIAPVSSEFLCRNNLIDNGGNSAYLYYLNKDIAMDFDIRPPEGYTIKPLLIEHGSFINSVWKYKHPGSEDYLKKLIERNLQLGIFDENNSPVAWCLRVEYGLLGTLQVIDNHKRRGFGALIVKALAKLCAEQGYHSGASIDVLNTPSQKLFEKIGFEKISKFHYVFPKLN